MGGVGVSGWVCVFIIVLVRGGWVRLSKEKA